MPSARMVMHRVKWVAFLIVATMGFLHGVERGSNELSAQNVRPPSNATTSKIPGSTRGVGNLPSRSTQQTIVNEGRVPGRSLGNQSDAELWRSLRRGVSGTVSIPDRQAGQLIQSEGELWRSLKNGPITKYGNWAMLASVILIALFFLLRGRIKVDHGMAGSTITRFKDMERVGHWLLAVSFIILAITGLNIAYGKYFMPAIIGKEAFASITQLGKWLHGHVAFAFMLSLVMVLVMWIKHNFPNRHDLIWLFKAGGLFVKNSHPPAKKFNAGQKLLFWLIILGGLSLSLSGIALMFPFQTSIFAKTFVMLNAVGFNFPTDISPLAEMQLATLWHSVIALALICVVIGHIYIGSLGMEGAFDAMGSGEVDKNWAKEHHSIWYEEVMRGDDTSSGSGGAKAKPAPAE